MNYLTYDFRALVPEDDPFLRDIAERHEKSKHEACERLKKNPRKFYTEECRADWVPTPEERNFVRDRRPESRSSANDRTITEYSVDCSEGIDGACAGAGAPEAADDGDGDGDGDGDPEPERQPKSSRGDGIARPRNCNTTSNTSNARNALPPAAEHFDRLPDSAHIDIAALKAITGKSRATLYRWIEKDLLPKPRKLGTSNNFWTAGDIRRALQA